MKKNLIILLLTIFSMGKAISQTPSLVVDAGSMFPAGYSGLYVHKGTYNNHPYWVGPKSTDIMAIFWNSMYNRYIYSNAYSDTNNYRWANAYDQSSNTGLVPTSGWGTIVVNIYGPSVSYSSLVFKETSNNDGSFDQQIKVSHNKLKGYYFAGNVGDDFVSGSKVTISNLADGLTAKMVKMDDSTLTLTLTGKATSHAVDTNFTIDFVNAAFAGGGTVDSTFGVSKKISINFLNVFTVGASGADFTTIKEGLKALNTDDVLKVFEGVYTEDSLINSLNVKEITIMGAGPSKTIIQGAAQPFTNNNGVFRLTCSVANFHNMTIQNGHRMNTNGVNGGAISSYGKIRLYNCRIINSKTTGKGNAGVYGGAIACVDLEGYNCEFSGNIADNEQKTGQIGGGAGYINNSIYFENCTVSGNYSRQDAGGFIAGNSMSKFINCTITNNKAETGKGGGISTYGKNIYVNTIVYGNTATNGNDIYEVNGHVYPIFMTKSILGDVTTITGYTPKIEGSYKKIDPKLDTLKFNCSDTRTHALLDGSEALDSGVYADTIPALDQRGFPILGSKDIGAQESINRLIFNMSQDTICAESKDIISLSGSPSNGVFQGEGVSGNTFDVSKVKSTGFVKITYSYNATGCVDLSTVDSIFVKVCTPSSVNELALPVSVYPNPVKNLLVVKALNNQPMSVVVTSVSGSVMTTQSSSTSETNIDMEKFPAGIYFLTITSGGKIANQKIIKQ